MGHRRWIHFAKGIVVEELRSVVWFLVDDGFGEHPKPMALPSRIELSAIGLWTKAGVWCAGQLTDGRMPTNLVLAKGGTTKLLRALVDVGLWHDSDSECQHPVQRCPGVPERGGLVFHDWFQWQRRTRQQILDQRQQKSAAGRAGGQASGVSRREKTGSRNEAPASRLVQPRVQDRAPYPDPHLIEFVCRRLFGDAPREARTDDLVTLWQLAAGQADFEAELRNFLIHNAGTHLQNPSAALLGWLSRAAERATTPGPKRVLGCPLCTAGWMADDPTTGMPRPCPSCKPHRYADGATA